MKAFLRFTKGLLKMPAYARAWVMLLMAVNMVVPIFYLNRIEAQVVLGVFMVSALLMMILTAISGFSRLLGLGHFLWFPLLYFLWSHLDRNPPSDFFRIWLLTLMTVNAISLIIDVKDVILYLTGDRSEMVEGLEPEPAAKV